MDIINRIICIVFILIVHRSGPSTEVEAERFDIRDATLHAEAGLCYDFVVVSRDASRNKILHGGHQFEVYSYQVQTFQHDASLSNTMYKPTNHTYLPSDYNSSYSLISSEPRIDYGTVSDHGNGNYSLQICPKVAGIHELHVLLNGLGVSNQPFQINNNGISKTMPSGKGTYTGQYVAQSPYRLIVSHSTPDATTSSAQGLGLSNATVGIPAYFVLTVRDTYYNLITNDQLSMQTNDSLRRYEPSITVSINQSPLSAIEVYSFSNGSFLIHYTPMKSSWNDLNVLVNGHHVAGSPFRVMVLDGQYSANYSYAVGRGLSIATAGELTSFEVVSLDIDGNRKSSSSDSFIYMISGSNNLSACLESCLHFQLKENSMICSDLQSLYGRYYGSYVPKISGDNLLSIYETDNCSNPLVKREISNSPFTLAVLPGIVQANNTLVRGSIYDAVAGEIGLVNLQLCDAFANNLQQGGDMIELTLAEQDTNAAPSYGLVADLSRGSFNVYYNLTVSGSYDMHVRVAEPGLKLSYFDRYYPIGDFLGSFMTEVVESISVNRNDTFHGRSEYFSLRYEGFIHPEYAQLYQFKVITDSFSSARLSISENAYPDTNMVVVLQTKDGNQGQGSFLFSKLASYRIVVEYSRRDDDAFLSLSWKSLSTTESLIPSSAFTHWEDAGSYVTTIHPAGLSSAYSTSEGQASNYSFAGEESTFTVYARDMYSNLLMKGDNPLVVFAIGNHGALFRGQVDDHGDGSYSVSYLPRIAGSYRLYVAIGCCPPDPSVGIAEEILRTRHLQILGSPFSLRVDSNVVAPEECTAIDDGLIGGYAGQLYNFTITYRDLFGNPTKSSDLELFVLFYDSVTSLSVKPSSIHFNRTSDEVASVMYNMTAAGQYRLIIRVGFNSVSSADIKGSPFHLSISASLPSPQMSRVRGNGLSKAAIQKDAFYDLILRDSYGNRLSSPNYRFYMRLIGLTENLRPIPIIPTCKVMDDFVYRCVYQAIFPGPYNLSLQLLNTSTSRPSIGSGLWMSAYAIANATAFLQPLYTTLVSQVSVSYPTGYLLSQYQLASVNAQVDDNIIIESVGESLRWQGYVVASVSDGYSFRMLSQNIYGLIYIDDDLAWESSMTSDQSISVKLMDGASYKIMVMISPSVPGRAISASLQWKAASAKDWSTVPASQLFNDASGIADSPYRIEVN
jgi:hypothetical protein